MRYALIGATGSVGQSLTRVLSTAGHTVRVLGRDATKLRATFGASPECEAIVLGDHTQATQALREVDVAVYLVGVPYTDFATHPKLTQAALAAAKAAGVKRFLHMSTVYPYGAPQSNPVSEAHAREPVAFKGRMRKEQEDLVLAAHAQGGMQTCIVRAPDFYGPEAEQSYVRDIFEAALAARTANVIAPVDTPHDFVFVPDLARALAQVSVKEEAYGRAWNFTGPGPMSTQAFAKAVFAAAGTKMRMRGAGKLMLRVLGVFNPMMREVVEMHYLWTTPVLLDDAQIRGLLPDFKKTPHTEAIKLTLDAMKRTRAS